MLDTSNPQSDALTIVLVTSVEVLGPAAAMLVVGDRDSGGVVDQNQRRLGLRVAHVVEQGAEPHHLSHRVGESDGLRFCSRQRNQVL